MKLGLAPDVRPGLRQDVMIAAAAVLGEVILTAAGPPELRRPDWLATVLWSVASAAPIVLRRVSPWLSVGLLGAGALLPLATGHESLALLVSSVCVTYTLAARLSLRSALLGAVGAWAPVFAVTWAGPAPAGAALGVSRTYLSATNALVALVCFLVGRTMHNRRAYTAALEERAEAAEVNQRALADQAVAGERRRIARELHDVVAHHVSVMGVLATGARRVLRRDVDVADEALATIEDTSRTTLREMRRMLDVLRTDAEPAADLAPPPDLAGIEALVEQVGDAGLPVSLRVAGTPTRLEPGIALTVYRIVQEALTNALKHAGRATAAVRLDFDTHHLTVEVFDTGRGPSGESRMGHGLVGMRERVALYGGTLRTGPRPGGGYRVYARIPIDQGDQTDQGDRADRTAAPPPPAAPAPDEEATA